MALIHYESEKLKQESTFKEQEKFQALVHLYTRQDQWSLIKVRGA